MRVARQWVCRNVRNDFAFSIGRQPTVGEEHVMIELLFVAQTCDFGNLVANDAFGIGLGVVKISFRKVSVVTVSMLGLDDRNSNPWFRRTGMQLGFPSKFRNHDHHQLPLQIPVSQLPESHGTKTRSTFQTGLHQDFRRRIS